MRKELKAQSIDEKKELSVERTEEAQKALTELESTLERGLVAVIDWESLKNHLDYQTPKPEKLVWPQKPRKPRKPRIPPKPKVPFKYHTDMQTSSTGEPIPIKKPEELEIPPKPKRNDSKYGVKCGILDKLFVSRRLAKEKEAQALFQKDYERWQAIKSDIERYERIVTFQKNYESWQAIKEERTNRYKANMKDYEKAMRDYEKTIEALEADYKAAIDAWKRDRQEYITQRDEHNSSIDQKRKRYENGDPSAVLDYCDLVLSNSEYPDFCPQSYELDYNPENKLLLVEYQLPSLNKIPTLREVKYVQSRDAFDEKHITPAQLNRLYDSLLYQVALRTIHELYQADKANVLDSIVFNGYVQANDPATGQETNGCVLSLQVGKVEFEQINLANVDPKACFRKLKGVGSAKLHSLTPIAPILSIDREDKRFVDSYAVADGLDEGENLAAMDWEDFEHLIRELFEKEFSEEGSEVKVTRASRDGGIDAVAFDPDPLRGGKIVIQAKRYTNVVSVSAVRDLFGTVMNEGANKGILVTTAEYGPDAYEFAKGKPLVLINGSNLLHLLEKHGHKARIDLAEAKRILAEEERG